MATKRIKALTATSSVVSGDEFPVDVLATDVTRKITLADLKTSLAVPAAANAAPPAVGTGTAGTNTGEFANENHTHTGVGTFRKAGDTLLTGAVTISGSGGTTLIQTGQDVAISSPALASAGGEDVSGSAGAAGDGTTSARANHTHRGVSSFRKSGDTILYGACTVSAGTGLTCTQTSQDVAFSITPSGTNFQVLKTVSGAAAWGREGEVASGTRSLIFNNGQNDDATLFTTPSGYFIADGIEFILETAVVGGGATATITVGTSAGGTQWMLSWAITSATAQHTRRGQRTSHLGALFLPEDSFTALTTSATALVFRVAVSGANVTAGSVKYAIYGRLFP